MTKKTFRDCVDIQAHILQISRDLLDLSKNIQALLKTLVKLKDFSKQILKIESFSRLYETNLLPPQTTHIKKHFSAL